jgi:hypothetical protein
MESGCHLTEPPTGVVVFCREIKVKRTTSKNGLIPSMHTFFHGWRRKAGVVTLVIALVFIGGWIRSMSLLDVLQLRSPWGLHRAISSQGRFRLWTVVDDKQADRFTWSTLQRVGQNRLMLTPIGPSQFH